MNRYDAAFLSKSASSHSRIERIVATTSKTRNIPFGRPIIGEEERQAVLEVLSGPILTHGPRVHEFEHVFARFTKAPFAVATASCTAALHLAYLHLGIGPRLSAKMDRRPYCRTMR